MPLACSLVAMSARVQIANQYSYNKNSVPKSVMYSRILRNRDLRGFFAQRPPQV